MKQQLAALWLKVQENKEVIIKIGAVLAGAALGAIVATVVSNAQAQYEASESELLGLDEEPEDLEDEE